MFAVLTKVRSNGGAAGIDGMTTEELPEHLRQHWLGIRAKLDKGPFVDRTLGIMVLAKVNGHRNFAAGHITAVAIKAGRGYKRT
jgi:RNA-directed DNA polymerase